MKELKELRSEIDKIDLRILELLEKRWKTAKEIGKIKRKKGLDYYDPEREQKIRKRMVEKTVLDKNFVKKIFADIMEYCRDGEKE